MVEMALALPLFLFVLIGTFQLLLTTYAQQVALGAAQGAARLAAGRDAAPELAAAAATERANEYRTFGQALEGLAEGCDTPELERVVRQLAANAAAGAGLVGAIQELLVGLRAEDRAALVAGGHKRAIGMLAVIAVFLVPPLLAVFLYPVIALVRSL